MPQLLDTVRPEASELQSAAIQTADGTAPLDLGQGDNFSLGEDTSSPGGFDEMMGLPTLTADQFSGVVGSQSQWFTQMFQNALKPQTTSVELGAQTIGAGKQAQRIIDIAHMALGTPYVWGGNSLTQGVDCSGFVQQVFKRVGINLPRVSYQQANFGKRIALKYLRPGDLVAWDFNSRNQGADHIAIYIGNGKIIEAPRPGEHVKISALYATNRAWGVRVLGSTAGGGGRQQGPQNYNRFIVQETGGVSGRMARNKSLGQRLVANAGWSGTQWRAFNAVVMKESGWDNLAQNNHSSAHGIGQFLDGTWGTVGGHYTNNAKLQILYMIAYIKQRYGTPAEALYFHNTHGWY